MKNKINILMVSSSSQLGGGTNHMFSLGKNLNKNFEVFYALPNNKNFSELLNSRNHIAISERKINLLDIYKINKFINKNSIDIIHAHGKGAGLISRCTNFFSKKILIYTFHGIHYECNNLIIKKIYILYERIMGKLDNFKILVSNSERKFAESLNLYLGNNFSIISNGVADRKIKNFSIDYYPKEEKLNNKKLEVISVCRFVEQKNISEIIKIAMKLPDINFTIVGEGDLWHKINDLVSKLNLKNVFLIGRKKNVFEFLYNSDIFLSTSLYEGLPISILEAMSIGLPIVASKVVGNVDTVEDGKSGFLYNLYNFDEAAEYISLLANNPNKRKLMGVKSHERHRDFFSLSNMINKYQILYESIKKG